ncbi:MAG: glycine cleavage system protein GcvH [Chloroflexi bacterium]|nr:glycine cleavage system protein GcvH [Chloroflexota bacterium]MDA1227545.1 glycine cleavage system protein GcvH [Chloroflexota bacterium]
MNPAELKYSEEHEWVQVESETVVLVGITEFAAESLGDVVYVDLPEVDANVGQFEKMGEIESVKAVSDLYSPVSGKITERNEQVLDNPQLVNDAPFEGGWLIRVLLDDPSQLDKLMSAYQYESFLASQD